MLQARFESGDQAGRVKLLKHFPVVLGRGASAGLWIQEPGVWDRHLEISVDAEAGFRLRTLSDARAFRNGEEFEETTLRNGDCVELGGVKLRLFLGEVNQRSLRQLETLTWIGLGLLPTAQIAIVMWLAH
jgi:hypothetical protein